MTKDQGQILEVEVRKMAKLQQHARSLAVSLMLLLAIVMVSCRTVPEEGLDGESPIEESGSEKVATIAMGTEFNCVNELVQPRTPLHNGLTYFALFEPLAEEEADYHNGWPSFRPRLAQRWEPTEDGLGLTYYLREDAVWSDGTSVTALDVRFTWQAQTNPTVGWAYREVKSKIRDVEVVDPHTVRFHFSEKYPKQLYDSAQGVILPSHAWGELPFEDWGTDCDWFNHRAVTTGPFRIDSIQPGQRVTLVRNDKYYEPEVPGLDRLVVEVVPERANRMSSLRTGRSHFVEFVEYADAEALASDPLIELNTYLPRNYYFVAWNNARPPFDSPQFRKALTLAIDRQEIVESLSYGYATVSHSPFASNVFAHHSGLEPLPYDPGLAKELLMKNGFTDSDGDGFLDREGKRLSIEIMTNSENALRRQIMVMIQSQLARLGIEVTTRTLDFPSVMQQVSDQSFDGLITGLSLGTDLDLYFNFHTGGIGVLNWSGFSDPETDGLIERVNGELELVKRKELFEEIQERLQELQPVTFLYEGQRLYAVRRPLTGVEPNVISSFANLRDWQWQE